nr:TetR/AcrR family transcriptional regulator [Microbacterium thalassium]
MGKRAESVARTRAAIREAARDEYAETGIDGASMQSIARRAGVAPGTVLYQYPDPDELAREVIQESTRVMKVPTAADVDADASLASRVRWLAHELFRVYAGTEREYQAWSRSRTHPVIAESDAWYARTYQEVLGAVLGPEHADPRAFQVASAVIDPGFRANLVARGMSDDEAADTAADLVIGWVELAS